MSQLAYSPGRARTQRAAVAAVVVGAAIGMAATPALAVQAPSAQPTTYTTHTLPDGTVSETVTLPVGTTTAHLGRGSVQATVVKAPNVRIDCTLDASVPAPYHEDLLRGSAWIVCTRGVAKLEIYAALYRNENRVSLNEGVDYNQATLDVDVYSLCYTGGWDTGTTGFVQYPAGYNPPTGDFGGQINSQSHYFAC